jgi:glycosyltransferase involved in cell wall biosynthesis
MRIHFVVPATGKTGGILVVLEYARELRKRGHVVRVHYPLLPYRIYLPPRRKAWKNLFLYLKLVVRNILKIGDGFEWFPETSDARAVPWVQDAFLGDADVVIATAWPTAYDVAALSPAKGKKFYFIQHYEDWNGHLDRLDASFRLPLSLLTIAPWLTELMRSRFGREVAGELHNGIDLRFFRPPASKPAGPLSILMMHHVLDVKGTPDGLHVLRRIHALFPEVKIRLFGMYPFEEGDAFMEHFRNPSRADLLGLYQQSHIFLTSSLSEGWHLPSVEAMACGCALVATRVGCVPVLERDGNLLSAEPGDRETLIAHLTSLILDRDLLEETARKGHRTVQAYDWPVQAEKLEEVLAGSAPPGRSR